MKNPTLDPEDWDVFRQQAHAMLDRAIDQMRDSGKGRVWTPAAKSLRDQLRSGLPETPLALSEVVNRLTALLPHGVGNTHPRFLAWVHGAGTPGNILAEMTAAAMNANLGGRDHAAIHVERQVLGWCRDLMGFPEGAGGLITSGTSAATVVALKVARDWAAGWETRAAGVTSARSLVGYASCEAHNCVARAFDLLGLGTDALRRVPANSERRMDTQALRRTIDEDRASGLRPFLLVGTAGTVNTGAIDDLTRLADIAEGEALWLHVDGAFGASLMLSESLRGRVAGLERAQSLAFDFHKWMQVNYAAG
ncbi:MAG TPA: cytochrome D ubiquinol oxidase subunit I, partial [Rhodobacteraceae bacterium]|nr:cytochrome D ubiquinol oxidase subunit I [Paracoccaceae bacterium]